MGPGTILIIDSKTGKDIGKLHHVHRHSPSGMNWGYGGSGPADAALSILMDCVGEDVACRYYQQFKSDVIANLPVVEWTLSEAKVKRVIRKYGEGKNDVCDKCGCPLERYEIDLCGSCWQEVKND